MSKKYGQILVDIPFGAHLGVHPKYFGSTVAIRL
jgi:hypothetical protein